MVTVPNPNHGSSELVDQLCIKLCMRPVMQSGKLSMPSTCQNLHKRYGRKQSMNFGTNGTFQTV